MIDNITVNLTNKRFSQTQLTVPMLILFEP